MEETQGFIDSPIREFGNALYLSKEMAERTDDASTKQMVMQMAQAEQAVLSNIKDMKFIGDIEVVKSSPDILKRFYNIGYRFKIQSVGYDILKEHFRCRSEHIPSEITLEFISRMIERYAQQQADKEYEDE